MPCVQAVARQERALYIQQTRRDLNEFEGITDPVEALKIIHRPRRHDPLVRWISHPVPTDRLYAELNTEQALRLAEYAESLIGSERHDEAGSIVLCLAAFTNKPLENCLRATVAQGRFQPSLAFHRAPADVRDQLVERVEWDAKNRNGILLALAWIGDEAVVDLFACWRRQPPEWRGSLHLPPEDYSREAGWELDENGQRRDLYFHHCWKLVNAASGSPELFQAIGDSPDSCPWCNQSLIHLFNFVPREFGLMTGLESSGGRIQVTTCEVCTAFGTVFGEYDAEGCGRWSPASTRPTYLPDDSASWDRLPRDPLQVAEARPPLFAASEFLPTTFSQLGGHPTWVQDATYPCCPKCYKTMRFLAQVDRDNIEDYAEGTYYAFVCETCRTTATEYQQT